MFSESYEEFRHRLMNVSQNTCLWVDVTPEVFHKLYELNYVYAERQIGLHDYYGEIERLGLPVAAMKFRTTHINVIK